MIHNHQLYRGARAIAASVPVHNKEGLDAD